MSFELDELVFDGGLEFQLGVVRVGDFLTIEELGIAQVLGVVRDACEEVDDVRVGLVEEGEQAVGVADARGVEVEVEVVLPVGLDRLEVGLVVADLDLPAMAVAERHLEAGHDPVIRLLEGVELVGLDRLGLEFAVVVLGRELAADLGLGTIGVHVEGAGEPLASLAHLHAHVAGPGDVGALALVRVLDHRRERRLHAALAVECPLELGRILAVEALLVVERRAPFHVVVGVAERQECARIGLAVVVVGADAVDAARELRAFLQDDVQRAADALAVDVARRAADDLDPLDQLGRNAVDDDGVVVRAAGHATAIDQDLGVFAADAAQRRLGVLADVALEADARDALHHVADRKRLEALEVFLVVGKDRRGLVDTISRVDALREHLDFGQLGLCGGRRLGEHRRRQGRKAHCYRDSRKSRKFLHR